MGQDVFSFDVKDAADDEVGVTLDLTFAGSATSGQVTGISGTVGSSQITGLDPSWNGPDNTFSTSYPYVDGNGISFDTSDDQFNLYDLSSPVLINNIAGGGEIFNQPITDESLTVCFAEGSRILAEHGGVAIERLQPGDLVRTASGALRPVKWIGHRRLDCAKAAHPSQVLPVRIARDAFGPGRPARDLYLSPAHAVCVDMLGEALIPIGSLINGATIRQIDVETVSYWHVELDSHDILLAENLPAESYVEMGNRGFFVESASVDLNAGPDAPARATAGFCRPFHVDGPLVEAARAQLAARAKTLGWRLEAAPGVGLHLEADGARQAARVEDGVVSFPMPRGEAWLICETSRPCDVGVNNDLRDLGVAIAGLTLDDGASQRPIALDDPRLGDGFYPVEDGVRRWTGRRAKLSGALFAGFPAGGVLRIALAADPLPRWIAPTQAAAERAA